MFLKSDLIYPQHHLPELLVKPVCFRLPPRLADSEALGVPQGLHVRQDSWVLSLHLKWSAPARVSGW